ncbi:MAG: hypothetical protein ACXVA9_03385, partial [Bdellovibrionales bacterium]
MVRSLILAVVLGWAGQSFAGVVCQEFSYQNSSKFSLTLSVDGSPVTLSGYLRFGDKVTVQQGLVSAEFKSYRQESSVVSAIINVEGQNIEGQKMSNLCLFDDVTLEVLTKNAIPEPRASMASSLEKLLAKLKEKDVKGWSTAQTFAWMADINKRTPGKQLFQYFDKVELGDVKLPRPEPRGSAGNTASVQTPSIPANPRALDPQALENPQYPMTPQQEQAYRQPGRPMPIGPDGEDNNDDDGIAPPVRRPYPQ